MRISGAPCAAVFAAPETRLWRDRIAPPEVLAPIGTGLRSAARGASGDHTRVAVGARDPEKLAAET